MEFNHLSFYVDRVAPWRDWFATAWGGQVMADSSDSVLVYVGQVPLLLMAAPAVVGDYLHRHPAGIGDMALRVNDLTATLRRVVAAGGTVLTPPQLDPWRRGRWAQIQGWGALRHTLVESQQPEPWVPALAPADPRSGLISAIDHAVVNVPAGELPQAIAWYVDQLGFQPRQQFTIDTPRSGLRSRVLGHPEGKAQIPINEPATANSQVQEYLHYNRGAGIQHVALHTQDIVQTVAQLRRGGVNFLPVPQSYYEAMGDRPGYLSQGNIDRAIARLQILVDWEPHLPQARLLQTFTQPCLNIPTVFFELIQRQVVQTNGTTAQAQGFGERNFQALFEAIEREQMKRGSLA